LQKTIKKKQMKHLYSLFIVILFPLIINAQEEKKEDTPSRIKVYTPTNSTSKTSSKDNSYKWAAKTDVLAFVAGEFPVILEYRILKKLSVEGSAGITYGLYPNDFSLSDDDENESSLESKAAMGTAFRAAIKYYPSSDYDAIEGWYFGIQLFNKTTNREYKSDSSDTDNLLSGKKDSKTKTGVSLLIGKQIFQDSNITFESYIGIGFANISREYFDTDYDSSTSAYALKSFETEKTAPNFQLGLKIGFGN
jgi:hypothetical protein